MSRRRALLVALAVVALALVLTPVALASAGGGSGDFGGGLGGDGGGGGAGKAFALYVILRLVIDIALIGHGIGLLVLIALALAYLFFTRGIPWLAAAARERRERGFYSARATAARQRRVELAAAEAADEDPAFAPDAVAQAAAALFCDVQAAWSRADRIALGRLLAPGLLGEWERRLDDLQRRGWHNRVEVTEPPKVAYVSLKRHGIDGDRVVVRIDARLRDYVIDASGRHIKRAGHATETVRTREFWTLMRQRGHWVLAAIERGAEGAHELTADLVATAWQDEAALRDETLVARATAEAPADTAPDELLSLSYEGDAHAALLDLSVADPRFSPEVLEVCVRRIADAWQLAVDGETGRLAKVASAQAADELLHPGGARTQLVVRGARVRGIALSALDAKARPPKVTLEVRISGRRYLQDRDTTSVLAGSRLHESTFTERWTLELDEDPMQPWRLAHVDSALAQV
jgi:predicted lipid-binding transport protein (Tim44 family)